MMQLQLMHRRYAILLAVLILLDDPAQGYVVQGPPPLDKIIDQSDIIFKGRVLSSADWKGKGLEPIIGFGVQKTEFKVISVLKGASSGDSVKFLHYDGHGIMFEPQYYRFDLGRTYLVCAKRTEEPAVFQQLWTDPTEGPDGAVVLCADDKPALPKAYKEVLCSELIGQERRYQSKATAV